MWTITPDSHGGSSEFLSAEDDMVEAACLALSLQLDDFCIVAADWNGHTLGERSECLDVLNKRGRALTKALFDGREDEFLAEIRLLGISAITQLIQPGGKLQRLIDLCVMRDDDGEFFLGERYLCVPRVTTSSTELLNSMYPRGRPPVAHHKIGYAEDAMLDSSCKLHKTPSRPDIEEIYVIGELAGDINSLSVLAPLDHSLMDADREELLNWLTERHSVLHFNCRIATPEDLDGNPGPPHLRVRANAFISASEMSGPDEFDFTGCFVFLNACASAFGNHSYRSSLAHFFRRQKSPCVACTTGPVDDAFATVFARELYKHLKVGKLNMSAAFQETRRNLTATSGHPMALLYTYIGRDAYALA
ncbi:CHAT domain-containing protein [Mesorhizobium sp. ES1-6]|uniref:CHAT domain-containing protein n=1 Tax=Mesorhizobium sp. ES1-6 TaxID=2876626 RepID=UPI001CCF8CB6|nr:CHAT domain-containing protein [Mesorhizobium sp. ES1-6]MBZ9801093.1 CHAT domain-containing protein [Mesorhizobium sp. ES1-6]